MTAERPHDHKPLWLGPDVPPICTCAQHFGQPLSPHPVPVKAVAR